jgi:tetratricopeptide (TPR) repeat protein
MTAAAISETTAGWVRQGRALFARCEFSGAVRAFRRAADAQPNNAEVLFWLGRSYERMAETSSPLIAPRTAHKAERSLEQALQLDPTNPKYLLELFDLYVDTPEWFSRAPQRASALLERMSTTPEEYAILWGRLAEARQNVSGLDASVERAILLPSRILGGIVR